MEDQAKSTFMEGMHIGFLAKKAHNYRRENKANKNKLLSYCEILMYIY